MNDSVDYTALLALSRRFQIAAAIAPDLMDKFLVEDIAKPIVEEMRKEAPVDSGQLRDSIRYVHPHKLKVVIGSFGVAYVKFVTEGTRPHEIRAKNSSVLSFKVGGKQVFATVVKHPGTEANPFMSEAADKVLKKALPKIAGIMMGEFNGDPK